MRTFRGKIFAYVFTKSFDNVMLRLLFIIRFLYCLFHYMRAMILLFFEFYINFFRFQLYLEQNINILTSHYTPLSSVLLLQASQIFQKKGCSLIVHNTPKPKINFNNIESQTPEKKCCIIAKNLYLSSQERCVKAKTQL